jgi:transposase
LQITSKTLIIGIDVAKDKHVARAQDDRGIEFGKRLIYDNSFHCFVTLLSWTERHMKTNDKDHVIYGVKPTGHF